MAYASTHSHPVLDRIASLVQALGEFFVTLATSGPHVAELERLNRLSDDDLAARGTTRAREVKRILGARALF